MAASNSSRTSTRRHRRRRRAFSLKKCVESDFCTVMTCLLAFLVFVTIMSCGLGWGSNAVEEMYLPVLIPAYGLLLGAWVIGGIAQYGPYAIIAVPVQILYTVVMFFGLILWLLSLIAEGLLGAAPLALTMRSLGGPTEKGTWDREKADDGPTSVWDGEDDDSLAKTYITYKGVKSIFDDD